MICMYVWHDVDDQTLDIQFVTVDEHSKIKHNRNYYHRHGRKYPVMFSQDYRSQLNVRAKTARHATGQ